MEINNEINLLSDGGQHMAAKTKGEKIMENNYVIISGVIGSEPVFSHKYMTEVFYKTTIKSKRLSGMIDTIPLMISEYILQKNMHEGSRVCITGSFRSRNVDRHLQLYILAEAITPEETGIDTNTIALRGYVCKREKLRETPLGRKITDLIIATHRSGVGKSDYIPCLAWERRAEYANTLQPGTELDLIGRLQSREYTKALPHGEEIRTVYEVSVSDLKRREKDEEK